jgi:hypothetical protein
MNMNKINTNVIYNNPLRLLTIMGTPLIAFRNLVQGVPILMSKIKKGLI